MAASAPRQKLPAWAKTRSRPRDPKTGFLKPRRCNVYSPGHSAHWIPAIRSDSAHHDVGILSEINEELFIVDFGTEYRTYRNHETERLVEIVGVGNGVRICERYRLARSRSGLLFSIALSSDPWGACDDSPLTSATPQALADRLNSHGGFSVPGRLVVESLRREDADQ